MSTSHQRPDYPTAGTHDSSHGRPRTAPAAGSTTNPPTKAREPDRTIRRTLLMPSAGSSSIQDVENQDPFEFLGCSNCTDDFFDNYPHSFWLLECGHLACAPCLGHPNGEVDARQHQRCPMPRCGGIRTMVYELRRGKAMDPAIGEFFESPHAMAERMDTVLSFQNRQMRLRISNLHKLVQVQRQALQRHNQYSPVPTAAADDDNQELPLLKQQVLNLKHQLRLLQLQLHQLQSATTPIQRHPTHQTALPNQPSESVIKRRKTVDPRRRVMMEKMLYLCERSDRRTAHDSTSRGQRGNEERGQEMRGEEGQGYNRHRLGAIPEDEVFPMEAGGSGGERQREIVGGRPSARIGPQRPPAGHLRALAPACPSPALESRHHLTIPVLRLSPPAPSP
ncbi:hypothetical protein VP01_1454g6 [Puccinia sorghi]|uniref:RING-type domain-containing protein n=1 Tax=Puccinia sorghi TaxID=27349 RepID=A0A0L6VJX4_9BASI|nr:hypothetical protein VP01_1454g6 [Puccinia sorghi]